MSISPNGTSPTTTAVVAHPAKSGESGYQSHSNAVSLISNPSPSVATYQWVPRGVKSLNRRNKLSSLPFWHPNDTMRTHQFRLVLLRGIVKEAREEDDPVAVFVEYVPPPSSPLGSLAKKSSGSSSGSSGGASGIGGASVHPNGCRVAVRLLHMGGMDDGDRSHDVVEEDTCVFDDEDRQIAFRDFLSAKNIINPSYSPDDGHSVVLEVTITVGVNVVAETVAKSTGQIAGSLWSTWSSLTTSVTTLYQKTVQVVQEQRSELESAIQTVAAVASGAAGASLAQGRGAATNSDEQPSSSSYDPQQSGSALAARELPWDDIPEKWIGRAESWHRTVTEKLVEDENTFLIGAKRGISSDEQMLLTQLGINHRAVMAADTLFDYERDVHEGLLSLPNLRAQRYRLVPLKVKDENFWANFMWKVACLSTCTTEEQAQLLLSIINAPGQAASSQPQLAPMDSATASASHMVHSWLAKGWAAVGASGILSTKPLTLDEVGAAVKEAVEAAATLEELIAEREANECFVGPAVSSCEACLASLQKLQRREGYAEFADVVQPALGTVQRQLDAFHQVSADHVKHDKDPPPQDENVPQEEPRDESMDVAPRTVDVLEALQQRDVVVDCREPSVLVEGGQAKAGDKLQAASEKATAEGANVVDTSVAATVARDAKDHDEQPNAECEAHDGAVFPTVVAAEKPSAAKMFEASFERLPSIDDIETPLVDSDRRSATAGGANTTGGSTGRVESGKKLDFEPMPWEDDDDA